MEQIKNRYDFVLLFDVADGNPNGDPDAGNLPRVDPETGKGLVTDVCLKRKIRNYIQLARSGQTGFDIFIKEKAILNNLIAKKYEEKGIDLSAPPQNETDGKKREKVGKAQNNEIEQGRKAMCEGYYDVRTFGAVMSTGPNAGQVRGPVQFTFGRSIDPVVALEHSITRMAVATEAEAESQKGDNRTMGRKFTVPYGLYKSYGFISPHLANQTGFDEEDLKLFWEAVKNMFEHDHSAARGMMTVRKLIVFQHDSMLGNAPSHQLFERITVELVDKNKPAREFSDYLVNTGGQEELPSGVKMIEML